VTGKNSAERSGALSDVKELCNSLEIKYVHFDEVSENPELHTVQKGAELMKEKSCDFIIGIGGGSPLDATKAISAISANKLKPKDIYKPEKIIKAYPIVAIPTTSGTGSEVTQYSVITDEINQKKAGFGSPLLFPKISFLDPKYTYTLPERPTRDTAIDALSHLLEGIYSKNRSSLLNPLIYEGISLIIRYLPIAIKEPNNFRAREKLMLASYYGGMVIAQGGTTLQHSIGYPLTTHYGLSHGQANGIVMKEIMELYEPALQNELTELFDSIGMTKFEFYMWLDQWDFVEDITFPEEFIQKSTEEIAKSRNMAANPRSIQNNEIADILRKISK
ncbi:MAG: iron-containing alcohol dehydrogenase, partial [Candidatus Cloacimonas sp.]|nr:iron-containing alcohol dehydrogenase [Candidatus Cloacimonadota bacterium]